MAGPPTPPPPAWGPPPSTAPGARTDPLAIVSLVASLAGIFFCGVGQIVGIVFGHIARSRIKRSGEGGAGIALAGIIVGYAEIALAALMIAGIVFVSSHVHDDTPDAARVLSINILTAAGEQGSSARSATVLRRAISETDLGDATVYVGASPALANTATDAELAAEGWRLEVDSVFHGEACIIVPSRERVLPRVDHGPCP
jgi:hypothetical protein